MSGTTKPEDKEKAVFTARHFRWLGRKIRLMPSAVQRRFFAKLFADYFFRNGAKSLDRRRWMTSCDAPMTDEQAFKADEGKYVYTEPTLKNVETGHSWRGTNVARPRRTDPVKE